jgi:hypothetical protein
VWAQSAAEHKAKGNEFFQKEKFAEVVFPHSHTVHFARLPPSMLLACASRMLCMKTVDMLWVFTGRKK